MRREKITSSKWNSMEKSGYIIKADKELFHAQLHSKSSTNNTGDDLNNDSHISSQISTDTEYPDTHLVAYHYFQIYFYSKCANTYIIPYVNGRIRSYSLC